MWNVVERCHIFVLRNLVCQSGTAGSPASLFAVVVSDVTFDACSVRPAILAASATARPTCGVQGAVNTYVQDAGRKECKPCPIGPLSERGIPYCVGSRLSYSSITGDSPVFILLRRHEHVAFNSDRLLFHEELDHLVEPLGADAP